MLKTEILDELFGIRDELTSRVIALAPSSPADDDNLRNLVLQRDRVSARINDIIAADFPTVSSALETAVTDLGAAAKRLSGTAKTLAKVQETLAIVDQILQVVSSVFTVLS